MSPRDLVYVWDMLDMARKAVSKTRGISRETYDADENLRLALIHLIQTIGEAARQVSGRFLQSARGHSLGRHRRHAPQGARLPGVDDDIVWQSPLRILPVLVGRSKL